MMIVLLSTLLACDDAAPTTSPTPTPAPAPAPTAEPAPAPAPEPAPALTNTAGGSLPDVGAGLQRGQCSSGPGSEGADSYFVGNFQISGSTVTGTETWTLYANPKWAAKGGRDCSVTWQISGSTSPGGGACGACDLTVRFHATADIAGSDCPEELLIGRLLPNGQRAGGEASDFDQTYAVQRRADGTARIHFGRSGKLLGEGYHDSSGFNYVSAHSCKWF